MNKNKLILFSIGFLLFSAQTFGQAGYRDDTDFYIDPNFAIAILAGVIIAIAVQIFLTALSIASGITAIGDLKEMYVKSRVHAGEDHDDDDSSNTGVKVATGVGIWSVLTLSISTFVGALLAMNLVVIESYQIATTVALVIWALFCTLVIYFEGKMLGSIVGGITNVATSGFKMSTDLVKGVFGGSQESKTKSIIDHSIEKVRKELDNEINLPDLKGVVENLVKKVDKKVPDYGTLKDDLTKIIKESQKESDSGNSSSNSMKWQDIKTAIDKASEQASNEDDGKGKVEKLKSLAEKLKSAYDEGSGQEEKMKNVANVISPKDEETTNKYVEKFMGAISSGNSESMSFDSLKETFKEITSNPGAVLNKFSQKISDLDQTKVKELLEKNTNLSEDQIESSSAEVEKYLRWAKMKVSEVGDAKNEWLTKIENAIAGFFNDTGRSELQYDSLKHDITKIFDDPKHAPKVIKARTEKFSADTFISLVTSHTSLSDSDIKRLKTEVEDVKSTVVEKMNRIESEVKGKIEMAKKKAVIQAEHARAAAAAAAWWLVFSGIISAAAAVGGAFVSM